MDKKVTDNAKVLEDAFFAERDRELLDQLRGELAQSDLKKALSDACGIHDDSVLSALVQARMKPETLVAVTLIPMIFVAWADGNVAKKEREAVLQAAEERNMPVGCPARDLLESWLAERPEPQLLAVWKDYVRALSAAMSAEDRAVLKNDILNRARDVAAAAGGIMGFHKISDVEQVVLDDLAATFA